MRILLHYEGNYLRYDLQISGLSSVLWADAGLYFCAQFYRRCWLPRGTRHEGLANLKNVPLGRVPLAGSLSLKGRQAEFYKYQSG